MAYMKKVTDATTDVGYGDGWFKISEAGFNPTSKKDASNVYNERPDSIQSFHMGCDRLGNIHHPSIETKFLV
jgi:hypothetical protein